MVWWLGTCSWNQAALGCPSVALPNREPLGMPASQSLGFPSVKWDFVCSSVPICKTGKIRGLTPSPPKDGENCMVFALSSV